MNSKQQEEAPGQGAPLGQFNPYAVLRLLDVDKDTINERVVLQAAAQMQKEWHERREKMERAGTFAGAQPDREFEDIHRAVTILNNPALRAMYDNGTLAAAAAIPAASGPEIERSLHGAHYIRLYNLLGGDGVEIDEKISGAGRASRLKRVDGAIFVSRYDETRAAFAEDPVPIARIDGDEKKATIIFSPETSGEPALYTQARGTLHALIVRHRNAGVASRLKLREEQYKLLKEQLGGEGYDFTGQAGDESWRLKKSERSERIKLFTPEGDFYSVASVIPRQGGGYDITFEAEKKDEPSFLAHARGALESLIETVKIPSSPNHSMQQPGLVPDGVLDPFATLGIGQEEGLPDHARIHEAAENARKQAENDPEKMQKIDWAERMLSTPELKEPVSDLTVSAFLSADNELLLNEQQYMKFSLSMMFPRVGKVVEADPAPLAWKARVQKRDHEIVVQTFQTGTDSDNPTPAASYPIASINKTSKGILIVFSDNTEPPIVSLAKDALMQIIANAKEPPDQGLQNVRS